MLLYFYDCKKNGNCTCFVCSVRLASRPGVLARSAPALFGDATKSYIRVLKFGSKIRCRVFI